MGLIEKLKPYFSNMLHRILRYPQLTETYLGNHVRVAGFADVRYSSIGDYSSIGRYSKITHTEIGKFCSISWDVTINAVQHNYKHISSHSFSKRPDYNFGVEDDLRNHEFVKIKNDVWVGAGVIILPGLTIGNGAVLAAGSVVTSHVPDYAIVAGVPARIIKYRFDEKTIARLLNIQWWEFSDEMLSENIALFQRDLDEQMLEHLEILSRD